MLKLNKESSKLLKITFWGSITYLIIPLPSYLENLVESTSISIQFYVVDFILNFWLLSSFIPWTFSIYK